MSDIIVDEAEEAIFSDEVSDESLEAAAFVSLGAYTQMGMCTLSFCSG